MLNICSQTSKHLRSLLRSTGHKHILVGVSGGGCNGLKYNLAPSSDPPQKYDEDFIVQDVPIRLCGNSILYLIGTDIKWITDAMGSRMEFNNPNANSSCGCGETFSI